MLEHGLKAMHTEVYVYAWTSESNVLLTFLKAVFFFICIKRI